MTPEAEVWEEQYRAVRMPHLDPAVTGFNACVDRIIPVTARLLESLQNSAVPGAEDLYKRLIRAMQTCTADEWFVTDQDMYCSLAALFRAEGIPAVGGQAGIAALHLRSIGVPSVTCVLPGAGPEICALLQQAGIDPMNVYPDEYVQNEAVHFVFEYPAGLVPAARGVLPRNNRFIASPPHPPSTVIVPAGAMDTFLAAIAPCRRAFLSGYQYLRTEQDFITAAGQLCQIRNVHTEMRTHVECVTVTDPFVLSRILRQVLPNADSIGLNERELRLLLRVLRVRSRAVPAASPLVRQVRGLCTLAEATGVPRIHLHTYGYYILVLDAGTAAPERSRDALILAARSAADAAGRSDPPISREGISACDTLRNELGDTGEPGIFMCGSHAVVAIPASIVQGAQKTTGLGDIISSTAFVADRF